jgi:hypothetical protein
MLHVLSLKVARVGVFHKASGCPRAGRSSSAEMPSGHGHQGKDRDSHGRGSTPKATKSRQGMAAWARRGQGPVLRLDGEGVFKTLHALLQVLNLTLLFF